MRTRLVVGLVTGALGTLVLACSSSSSPSGPPPNPYPDVNTFCAKVAAAECQATGVWAACSVSDGTTTSCESFRQSECLKGSIVVPFPGSASALSRTYTSGNVQACLDALNGSSAFGNTGAAVSLTYSELFGAGGLVSVCEQVFVGSAAHGAACNTNYDCTASGDICAPVIGQTAGQCSTPTPKKLGDVCADPGDQCATGSYCAVPTSGLPKCTAIQAVGQSCTTSDECGSSARCAGGTCAALGGTSAPCASNDDCDPAIAPFCDVYRPGGAVCAKGLGFTNASPDCEGFLLGKGLTSGTPDAGGGDSGSSSGGDSGTPADAASGG